MPVKSPQAGDLDPIETASRDEISALQLERLQWSIRHTYDNVEAQTLPAITVPGVVPTVARAENTETTLKLLPAGADLVVWAKSLQVDFNNSIKTKEYTSHEETGIDDRKATWSLRLAQTVRGTQTYRVVVAGDALHLPAISAAKAVRVV